MIELKNNNHSTVNTFKYLTLLLVGFCILFSGVSLSAQTQKKKDLESRKQEIQKEIDYQNKLLGDIKKNKNRSMIQLAILNNKISRQKELIATINSELNAIEGNITVTSSEIHTKELELTKLKYEYAKIIYASYMNRDSYMRLMFLFASSNFNQAFQRIKFMQYYAEARGKQAGLIEGAQRQLNTKKQELESRKNEQSKTLNEKQIETGSLSKQKKEKEVTLTDLQLRERDIRADIKKKKNQAEKLRKAIERVIDIEIKKSIGDSKIVTHKITLTPEERELSNDFEGNQGKLPWPLLEGVITESFGTHDHPDLPGIKISNNGVNIATNGGSSVRTVFGGMVVAVTSIGGVEGKVVIIKHGEYLTVYSNLEEANVKNGEKVKTKQAIGKVLTDDKSVTELHFEVWKGQNRLNPETWILKGN